MYFIQEGIVDIVMANGEVGFDDRHDEAHIPYCPFMIIMMMMTFHFSFLFLSLCHPLTH